MVALMASARIVPVVTVDDERLGAPVAAALARGGLPVVEITLRTPAGLSAIEQARARVPEAVIGAGSVTSAHMVDAAVDAGAEFLVSPGFDEAMVAAARERNVLLIPGVATATELMGAVAAGVELVKLFPAEVVGGIALIRALSSVWPTVRFLPTGGISELNAAEYLRVPSVAAVGGSWMVSAPVIREQDWDALSASARRARAAVEATS